MPTFLPPGSVRFELQNDQAVLRLDTPAPAVTAADRWSLLSRTTLCVLDGPDDAGYLMARVGPDGDAAPPGWDDAVTRSGGSLVVFGDDPGAERLFIKLF